MQTTRVDCTDFAEVLTLGGERIDLGTLLLETVERSLLFLDKLEFNKYRA